MGSLPDIASEPEGDKTSFPRGEFYTVIWQTVVMKNFNQPLRKLYTEQEAAQALGISLPHLHIILDENIFNDGGPRPANVMLEPCDLILLEFWTQTTPNPKVVRMPRRFR